MSERISSVPVDAGLYVLRYVAASVSSRPQSMTVRPAAGHDSHIDIISAPGVAQGSIDGADGCVVVRASRSGSLEVVIRDSLNADGAEVELRLELLASGNRTAIVGADAPSAVKPMLLEVIGHVSRRGDVKVTGDHWIAGPDQPAPIEGVRAQLVGATSDLELEYQVLVSGASGSWTEWKKNGVYAGTQGQFRPLLGLRLRLSGSRSSSYALQAHGLFLGSSIKLVTGQQVELISGSGVDPLVGLKIALNALRTGLEQQRREEPVRQDPRSEKRSGRVRVFRASAIN